MTVPSKDQLTDNDGLDEHYVVKHWNGKTLDDAYRMFTDGGSAYCEDITYMSVAALHYYLPAVFAYLQNTDSNDDLGAVSLGRELFGSFRADCSIRGVRSDWEGIRR